jgi:DNA polymerase
LKQAIIAPINHVIINCDSSQIEARVLAWLSNQIDVVEQFTKGEDVYSSFASKIYNKKITKANPIERFVGKTCVLGLGYGTGWKKLQHTLKTQSPTIELSDGECKNIVNLYREVNSDIINLWSNSEGALDYIVNWNDGLKERFIGKHEVLSVTENGIKLPNNLFIKYPELLFDANQKEYSYKSRKGRINVWGGTVVENVVQALARIVIGEQMIEIAKKYKIVLTVHDAAVVVVPEKDQKEATEIIEKIMSTPPIWGRTLPIACESGYGYNYGDC